MISRKWWPTGSLLVLLIIATQSHAQTDETEGYTCPADNRNTAYPCQAYAFYGAAAPNQLDLASIGDLFSVSRLMISKPSNISNPSAPLSSGQSLFVPLNCSCVSTNTSGRNSSHSYANLPYQIQDGDTYYVVSTTSFQNLTTYQAVELVNPTLVPTNLTIGVEVIFPIFCQCPNRTQLQSGIRFIITYVSQPGDTLSSVATRFGSNPSLLNPLNGSSAGGSVRPFTPILVPVTKLPVLQQPQTATTPPSASSCDNGPVVGLSIGVGVLGLSLLVAVLLLALALVRLRRQGPPQSSQLEKWGGGDGIKGGMGGNGKKSSLTTLDDPNLMVDISECLDRYRVFQIEELRQATSDFDRGCLIQGSVYKGWLHGEAFAIKRMKWNAWQELRILQKVNHSNLVMLEGFCVTAEDGTCYLVYEFIENGSLHSWLHKNNNRRKLDWRTRLRVALDVANGLQYIHEHTWPTVVHKDIKSSNVLLDSKMRAKIANFGLARSGCNAVTTNIVGTQGYIAPEYLADGLVTTKMDVFAYGVVLLELVSGKEAVNKQGEALWMDLDRVDEGKEGIRDGRLRAWMDSALIEQGCAVESVASVMAVARSCLQRDPSKRPSMVDVVYTLSRADELDADFSGDAAANSGSSVVGR